MATHVWSVACKRPILDSFSGSLSLIDIIEVMNVRAKKGDVIVLGDMFNIVTYWSREKNTESEKVQTRINLYLPDKSNQLLGDVLDIDLSVHLNNRSVTKLESFVVGDEGLYDFVVEQKKTSKWLRAGVARILIRLVD